MYRVFVYRLYPNAAQERALAAMLETHRRLYNDALAERKLAWEQEQRGVTYGQQAAALKASRASNPFLAATNFSSCQATLRRLDRAFQAFFRRVKAAESPGYPRFRGRGRFRTVAFPSHGDGCRLDEATGRVYLQYVGLVKVKLHRPIEGPLKTLAVTRKADGWHLVVSCDLGDTPPASATGPAIGIDLGLAAFIATSDGLTVAAPRVYRRAQARLRKAQRRVARRVKGSARRRTAVRLLAKAHLAVANARKDFHYKTARALVAAHPDGIIAHERLNTAGLARTRLAKSVHDAGWAQFIGIVTHKAVSAGVVVVAVPPHGTSQRCSACEAEPAVPKTLKDRWHTCSCGCSLDRDVNAARNVLRLGLSRQASTWAAGPCVA
jgi:putative transposase